MSSRRKAIRDVVARMAGGKLFHAVERRQRMRGRPRLTVGLAEQLVLLLLTNVDSIVGRKQSKAKPYEILYGVKSGNYHF